MTEDDFAIRYLFIGGPADREYLPVPPDQSIWHSDKHSYYRRRLQFVSQSGKSSADPDYIILYVSHTYGEYDALDVIFTSLVSTSHGNPDG